MLNLITIAQENGEKVLEKSIELYDMINELEEYYNKNPLTVK